MIAIIPYWKLKKEEPLLVPIKRGPCNLLLIRDRIEKFLIVISLDFFKCSILIFF